MRPTLHRSFPFLLALAVGARAQPPAEPQSAATAGAPQGFLALAELGCVHCHAPGALELPAARIAPDLRRVRSRLRPAALEAMIAAPHAAKPGTPMPALLDRLAADEREAVARAIAHYLRSLDATPLDPRRPETGDPQRGHELFHTIGCVACHAPRDARAKELPLPGDVPLGDLARRTTHASLVAFLEAPARARPAGRMPSFALQPAESHALADFLLQAEAPPDPPDALLDPELAARGRGLFAAHGCAACHTTGEDHALPSAPPLHALRPTHGCLADDPGPWPRFALDAERRHVLRAALGALDLPPRGETLVQLELEAHGCLACHVRGTAGGVARARDPFFTGADANLGEPGRIPPPLTGVGAKLQPEWLRDAIADGQRIRPYVATRMPGFGEEVAARLTARLVATDHLEPAPLEPLPRDRKEADAVRELGRLLVGDQGMDCLACHTFRDQGGEAMPGIDLVESTTRRLTPAWFYHYMLEPARFQPGTVMPQYFLDGVSVRDEIAGGDPVKQLSALWHYMEPGRNAREPSGLRRAPIELEVGDEAVMLRRSVQGAGKRGIAIGYPGGVNATFDAEHLAWNHLWWGRFVDAAPVWTGQGSGEARILERRRLALPGGPALLPLANQDEPWPEASRRDLGHVFLGYTLDERRRPTFAYRCGTIVVHDHAAEVRTTTGATALRRTITLDGPRRETFYLRAARGPQVALEDGGARLDATHRLRFGTTRAHLRTRGDDRELLLEIPPNDGSTTLVLTYARDGEAR